MQDLVASVDDIKFDIEIALEQQLGATTLPFLGMDKSGSAICTFYMQQVCNKGNACPFRHVRCDRTVVCKHWLRGLCKKGDDCEFLHEYDMSKMPECYFYSKFGECSNKECPFLHIDPEANRIDCPWYDRGFCRHGPLCHNRHVRRILCVNFLCGFCLDGKECKFMHPRFELPPQDQSLRAKQTAPVVCHSCHEFGHKAYSCPKSAGPNESFPPQEHTNRPATQEQHMGPPLQPKRPISEIVCYKCGEKGHYANRCPKGHLAFLSNTLAPANPDPSSSL